MTVINTILNGVKEDLAYRKHSLPQATLEAIIKDRPPVLDAFEALNKDGFQIIAEVKRATPEKGILSAITDPGALAKDYVAGGAAIVSIQTEERHFMGNLNDLREVREAVQVPILRKDFMIDEYQFYEARAYGTDLALLNVSILDDAQLKDFYDLTHELGMHALVETHSESELQRAAEIEANIFGVNVRNLRNLEFDPQHFEDVKGHFAEDGLIVSQSGALDEETVYGYALHGAKAAIVGEALVTSHDPAVTVQQFLEAGNKGKQELAEEYK
ncbi:MAG: indole-3-glycerol phosphate synthase TrpC [Micrococcaceae bacterium]